jgi:hypothetical protein
MVRRPVAVSCPDQCVGIVGDLIPNATASVVFSGVVSNGHGIFAVGTPVQPVLTR